MGKHGRFFNAYSPNWKGRHWGGKAQERPSAKRERNRKANKVARNARRRNRS